MVSVKNLYEFLDEQFPYRIAEKDDNSGFITGDLKQPVKKVLLSLDITFEVIDEAISTGCDLIVSHHPIVFEPLKAVTMEHYVGKKITLMIKNNISAISCHTNLDIAEGGLNDIFASLLGLKKIKSFLKTGEELSSFGQEKEHCLGRIGETEKTSVGEYSKKVKAILGCESVRYCDSGKAVQRVAVIGGGGATFYSYALKAGADTFVTGDGKYSAFLTCKEMGLNLIDAGHFQSENIVFQPLKDLLSKAFPEVEFILSEKNKDCIQII